jgi:hypothetical protein
MTGMDVKKQSLRTAMLTNMIDRLKTISLWHLLWISLVLAEFFTAVMNTVMGLIWWGRIDRDLILIGTVDAFIVALFVSGIIILILRGIRNYERRSEERIKKLAQELKTILDTLTVGVSFIKDRRVQWANAANSTIFGGGLEETMDLETSTLYADEDGYKRVGTEGYAQLAKGEAYTTEMEMKRKDGTRFWCSLIGRAINPGNLAEGSIWMLQDITERKQVEELIRRSLSEKEVLLKEIHHRVKNNMQVVSSLLMLQSKYIRDDTVRAIFNESRNRIHSMSLIHEKLYGSADLAHIDFSEYAGVLVKELGGMYNRPDIAFSVNMPGIPLDINTGIPCGLIINELVSNSLKHAFTEDGKGTIIVGLCEDHEGRYVLTVEDDGIGFPADLDFRDTSSLGLQLVTTLATQLNGTIELFTGGLSTAQGTVFKITFPGPPMKGA